VIRGAYVKNQYTPNPQRSATRREQVSARVDKDIEMGVTYATDSLRWLFVGVRPALSAGMPAILGDSKTTALLLPTVQPQAEGQRALP
jgi:hypothetical protein